MVSDAVVPPTQRTGQPTPARSETPAKNAHARTASATLAGWLAGFQARLSALSDRFSPADAFSPPAALGHPPPPSGTEERWGASIMGGSRRSYGFKHRCKIIPSTVPMKISAGIGWDWLGSPPSSSSDKTRGAASRPYYYSSSSSSEWSSTPSSCLMDRLFPFEGSSSSSSPIRVVQYVPADARACQLRPP